jgi:hypothetical protein
VGSTKLLNPFNRNFENRTETCPRDSSGLSVPKL